MEELTLLSFKSLSLQLVHEKEDDLIYALTYLIVLCSIPAQVVPVSEETEVPLLLGLFLSLRHMVPHLGDTTYSTPLQGSFGTSSRDEEVKVTTQQLVQVGRLLLYNLCPTLCDDFGTKEKNMRVVSVWNYSDGKVLNK